MTATDISTLIDNGPIPAWGWAVIAGGTLLLLILKK